MIHPGISGFCEQHNLNYLSFFYEPMDDAVSGPEDGHLVDVMKASAAYTCVAYLCGNNPVDSLDHPPGGDWVTYWKIVHDYAAALSEGVGATVAGSDTHRAALDEATALSLNLNGYIVEA